MSDNRELYFKHIQLQKKSGIKNSDYCRQHDLDPSMMSYYKNNPIKSNAQKSSYSLPLKQNGFVKLVDTNGFIEIQVNDVTLKVKPSQLKEVLEVLKNV